MLPASARTSSDLTVLKEILLKEMLADMSILDLQFNKSKLTRVGDLIIFKYDEDFGQAIEVDPSVVFLDKDIVMVKLRKVAVQLSDYEEEPAQKIGKKTLLKFLFCLSLNLQPNVNLFFSNVDQTSTSSDTERGSTDFVESSSDETSMYTSTPHPHLERTGASSKKRSMIIF
jgi:hypothetical protein